MIMPESMEMLFFLGIEKAKAKKKIVPLNFRYK